MKDYQNPVVKLRTFDNSDVVTNSNLDNVGEAKSTWAGWFEETGGDEQ